MSPNWPIIILTKAPHRSDRKWLILLLIIMMIHYILEKTSKSATWIFSLYHIFISRYIPLTQLCQHNIINFILRDISLHFIACINNSVAVFLTLCKKAFGFVMSTVGIETNTRQEI